ncbi:efflux RND transporter periplasmic adaptor subunit [Euryhalocaulis caribicus]|uniref:efflux RND transporter periplasmic adaptor subunit n=1 Tax=Euryhalocaulis caribicus TaxID=1161401 RepID=UPI00039C1343|nr:efflux RND transporter periplasmic adaptor subunit [Euryhalocaulis caribicus]
MSPSRITLITVLLAAAAASGYLSARLTGGVPQSSGMEMDEQPDGGDRGPGGGKPQAREILYWKAPMDPSYRRDEPGKSPMGMDLVPVYADEAGAAEGDEPALRINPAVVNNIGVRTATAAREDLSERIETVGYVTANEDQESVVTVRSEGWVERLTVASMGARVQRGDLLFQLYSPKLVSAQSEYLQARRLGRPALTGAATERLRSLGMTQAQIESLASSGATRRSIPVYAPQNGVVTEMNVREGAQLMPGQTAMRLADLSTVWVIADVFESAAGTVAEGQDATMTLASFPSERWSGEVDYVYPTADADARTVRVRLRFSNSDGRLKPNMYANIRLESGDTPAGAGVTIPQAALIRGADGDRVILALGAGRFRPAQVTAGASAGDRVEILSGLAEGERVVVSGQFLIDSEASLDAALMRLDTPGFEEPGEKSGLPREMSMDKMNMDQPDSGGMGMDVSAAAEGVGVLNAVDAQARTVNLSHEPIPAIGWPAMRMDFEVAPDVVLGDIETGDQVEFSLQETGESYTVTAIAPAVAGEAEQ